MAKIKSHSGARKRFKVTGKGKIMRRVTGRRHLLECKSGKTSRKKREYRQLEPGIAKKIRKTIPYGV